MPILYGENTFRYEGFAGPLQSRILDASLKHVKHLELETCASYSGIGPAADGLLTTLGHLIKCGCELRSVKIVGAILCTSSFSGDTVWTIGIHQYENIWRRFIASQEVMTALVKPRISQTLALSIWVPKRQIVVDRRPNEGFEDEFKDFVSRLASERGMTAMMQESSETVSDWRSFEEEFGYEGLMSNYTHKLTWCLRP